MLPDTRPFKIDWSSHAEPCKASFGHRSDSVRPQVHILTSAIFSVEVFPPFVPSAVFIRSGARRSMLLHEFTSTAPEENKLRYHSYDLRNRLPYYLGP